MFDRTLAIWYSLLVIVFLIIATPLWNAEIQPESDITKLLISFDDPKMTVTDLAFYLETHNFKATPMGSYVELSLPNRVCQLFPNGNYPGLCNMTCKWSNMS